MLLRTRKLLISIFLLLKWISFFSELNNESNMLKSILFYFTLFIDRHKNKFKL